MKARFVHTNLIARDCEALARFYESVFGCVRVPPARDYQSAELDAGTGLVGTRLRGWHLRLPGHGESGPTLEIFSYEPPGAEAARSISSPGFGHIAFEVQDVEASREEVLAAGGGSIGEVVTLETADGRWVVWCYVADPEGNAIELQSWQG